MTESLSAEVENCIKRLKEYLDEGIKETEPIAEEQPAYEEIKPEKFKPLKPVKPSGLLLSVDASSYPLMAANNWRIGVSRCAYVVVEVKGETPVIVDEGYEDHLFAVVCERRKLPYKIWEELRTFESNLALKKLKGFGSEDYCLLDGAAYFGGSRSFTQPLYDEARRRGVKMVMIPKNSPRLRDGRGRDLLASLSLEGSRLESLGSLPATWVYSPITKMAEIRSLRLNAEVSAVKLSPSSRRVFRCDVVDYLYMGVEDKREVTVQTASELAYVARDARCDGYPAPLYLAHQHTSIPEAKLLEYEELVRRVLKEAGLLMELEAEVELAGFRKLLLGLGHDYQMYEEVAEL